MLGVGESPDFDIIPGLRSYDVEDGFIVKLTVRPCPSETSQCTCAAFLSASDFLRITIQIGVQDR